MSRLRTHRSAEPAASADAFGAAEPQAVGRQLRMSSWRRQAIGLFPEFRQELNSPDYTLYLFFADLLPKVRQAHAEGDESTLKRAYGFAAWCASQEAKDLWNAAGVSFYEHVFDHWDQRHFVVPWLSPEVISGSWGLWELRLNADQLAELRHLFANRRERKYFECA